MHLTKCQSMIGSPWTNGFMSSSVERMLPFDFFPRLIDQESWEQISR